MTEGAGAGFVEPAYGSSSLGDVLPAVATALGVDAGFDRTSLRLPEASSYVVMLVDGLGLELLHRHPHDAPFLNSLVGQPGTAGVPSTTATSLTSLGTALPPGQHGLVGFTSRVPGTDRLLNALYWDESVDPLEWQPHETAFARLERAGVRTSVVSKSPFEGSGLTRSGQRGARYHGADRFSERLSAAVSASAAHPSLTYVYDSKLDATGHKHGVDSVRWRGQLVSIDDQVEQMREALPEEVRLLVVADHGMVDAVAETDRIDIDAFPQLRTGVALVGGEARFRQLYCHVGASEDVAGTWQSHLGDRAEVLTREVAIARGWFGEVEERVLPRLGDVVVAARGNTGLFSSVDFAYEQSLVGLHGSLTPEEMHIPILTC